MRRFLGAVAVALHTVWLATPAAAAQFGIAAGGARDFLKIDDEWIELTSPLAGVAYDVVFDDAGTRGVSFGARYSQDGGLISEYAIDYWRVGSTLEMFARAKADLLDKEFLGEYKLLGGVGCGFRFDVQNLPFEVSAHYARGADGIEHAGGFFGLRATLGGEE